MFRSMMLAAALALAPVAVGASDAPGTITILEGQALIYRGAARLIAQEGVRLVLGDMVETAEATFAQIELSDQSVLQLGPSTRLMLSGATVKQKPERWVYVMNGWGKLSGAKRDAKGGPALEIRAPLFEIAPNPGVIVFQASPAEVTMFAERGDFRIAERQASGPPIGIALKSGEYYRRKSGARGATGTAAPEFLAKMPRHYRDSLPSRLDKYRIADVRPKEGPDFTYADVEHWLKAEPSVRRQFVQRYRAKSKDAAFRAGLVANLSSHFEWDPVLFPEKYLPKDPPPPPPPRDPLPSPVVPSPVR